MKIQSNVAALAAQRNLGASDGVLGKSIGKLSSGFRLNKASDDAAGMGIANKIRADVRSLMQASRNASQATALVQVAEGAVGTISNILDRMKELATQSASDSVTQTDRVKVDTEYQALQSEITRITQNTKYQGQTLLAGTYGMSRDASGSTISTSTVGFESANVSGGRESQTYTISVDATSGSISLRDGTLSAPGTTIQALTMAAGARTYNFDKLGIVLKTTAAFVAGGAAFTGLTIASTTANGGTFQVGSENTGDSKISLALGNLTLTGLGVTAVLGDTISSAQAALTAVTSAIDALNVTIGTIGAASNRFDYAIQNLQSIIENMGAAESVIRDADVGQEMTTFTKAQILSQAGTAMLAQANAAPQSVLSLLKG